MNEQYMNFKNLEELEKIANDLDQRGLVVEADILDGLIREAGLRKHAEPFTITITLGMMAWAALAAAAGIITGVWAKMSSGAMSVLNEAGVTTFDFKTVGPSGVDAAWEKLMAHLRKEDMVDILGHDWPGDSASSGLAFIQVVRGYYGKPAVDIYQESSWKELIAAVEDIEDTGDCVPCNEDWGYIKSVANFQTLMDKHCPGWCPYDNEDGWMEAINMMLRLKRLVLKRLVGEHIAQNKHLYRTEGGSEATPTDVAEPPGADIDPDGGWAL